MAEKVSKKEKEVMKKSIDTLPNMSLYERGFMIGLMTAYATKYESKQSAGNE